MSRSEARQCRSHNEHHFSIDLQQTHIDENQIGLFRSSSSWPYKRKNRKGRVHHIDLKSAVRQITLKNKKTIDVVIRTDCGHTVRASDILVGVFGVSMDQMKGVRILKYTRDNCGVDNPLSTR